MRSLKESADLLIQTLCEAGIEKYAVRVGEEEMREFNTENGEFVLMRTLFTNNATVTVFSGGKKGIAAGNDFSDEGLKKLAGEAVQSAMSAQEDEANDLAPCQGSHAEVNGPQTPGLERFYDMLSQLMQTIETDYPKVRVMAVIASHRAKHELYRNSNGTEFDIRDANYDCVLEFSAFEGDRGTGISFFGFTVGDIDRPLIEADGLRRQLKEAEDALTVAELSEKFEGKVLFTPQAAGYFLDMLADNYMNGSRILSNESMWKDRLGEKVASELLTLRIQADDSRLVDKAHFTSDGFAAENVVLIENGILKNHILNLYVANKTGRPVTKNDGRGLIAEPGSDRVEDLLAGIDRGLVVGGFSGGAPGANGEFSGVAKNSFYVENGRIAGAVNEVMISGNLASLFENIKGISDVQECSGSSAMPWILTDGVVISGNQA